MNKRTRWIIIILICLLVVGMVTYPAIWKNRRLKEENKALSAVPTPLQRQRALNVNAEIVEYTPMSDKTITIGSIIPFEEVDLMFETSGKVVGIYFEEGKFVEKGTLLAKINDLPLQAQLKKLEAQTKLAQDRVHRQQTLLERDAVSQEAYETVVTEYNKLMADIDLVKANIDQTELRAPFDGVIGLRYLSEGAFASPTTRVARLAMVSTLKLDFSIPESYASEVGPGTNIKFSMRDGNGIMHEYAATIYAVESAVDLDMRTLRARATFPNISNGIVPGTFVSIEIMRNEIENALSVPSEAIIPEMGRNIVYIYRGGTAQPVVIETGLRTEARVQAISGLHIGDTLLTSGVMQLRTGTPVVIDNLK